MADSGNHHHHKTLDLIGELVHRLLSTTATTTNHHHNAALKYALRLLSSRMNSPSIEPNEAAIAESIKRGLATQGKSSQALTFSDLSTKFNMKVGPGSVQNKWAVLYLLKTISDDRKTERGVSNLKLGDSLLPTLYNNGVRNGEFGGFRKDVDDLGYRGFGDGSEDLSRGSESLRGASEGLGVGNEGFRGFRKESEDFGSRGFGDGSGDLSRGNEISESLKDLRGLGGKGENLRGVKGGTSVEKRWNGGVLMVSKDPENLRDMGYKKFVEFVRETNEVNEEVLVRDVLYACQGIDGKFVKYDKSVDGYVLPDVVKVSKASRVMVRKLCELGWLFRKVKDHISESMERFPAEDIGTVGQAFCAALQDELSEYYKLLAVLEAQAMNPIPLVSDNASSGSYLSLRRLSVWFAEPLVKMRLMAVLVDSCKVLKGGAMAGAIHMHAQHGDPLVNEFLKSLLRRVCSPLFEMVRSWVLEGELEDIFSEFFVLSQPVKAESLWREGYQLHSAMLPSFISQSLAQRILRTGKSINFLRVCCEDSEWANAATEAASAAGTTTSRGGLGYGETDALESLVSEAAKRIDKHLLNVIYERYKFKEHCLAIKRYLLLGRGDFVQYLMDIVGPDLSEPANTISAFKLAGLLESAVRSSNAQYDESDILDRLRVKMMPHKTGDRGWDVFSLEYVATVPLNTVFTESVMSRYLKIFNFLWKLRRVEHALIGAWKMMKPNCITSSVFNKLPDAVKSQLVLTSRKCQVLWDEMNHFVSNLQYYIMFEVLEVSWSNFLKEMELAKDLDDLLEAHEKYLLSIIEKSLLGERSQNLHKNLFVLFDLILRFRSLADRLFEGINELQSRTVDNSSRDKARSHSQSKKSSQSGSWLGEGRKALTLRAGDFFYNMGQDIDAIAKEYSSLFHGFISQLPVQQHVDLKFLTFRLDFTEFYTQPRPEIMGKLSA